LNKVYLLEHFKLVEGNGDKEDVKYLGVYSSKKKALEEMKKYKKLSELKGYHFYIDKHEIDRNLWEDDFITCHLQTQIYRI